MSHLGDFLHNQRLQMNLSLGQLARKVGYRNVSKGARRIALLEQKGDCKHDLLVRVAEALGTDLATVESLIQQDHQERLRAWEAWVNEPVPMRLIVRYMAAVYGRVKLPDEITTPAQAEAFACEYAQQHRHKVCLAVSRRLSIWIDAEGRVYARTEATPDDPNMPYMTLKGGKTKFLMNFAQERAK